MPDHRKALLDLAELLALSPAGMADIALGFDRPAELIARFAGIFAERGIDRPVPALPWIRLVDALCEEGRCAEIDWKADEEEVAAALARLGVADAPARDALARAAGLPTDEMLRLLGEHCARGARALLSIDYGADSYALIVVPASSVARAKALGAEAGFGGIVVWRSQREPKRPAPEARAATRLRDLGTWEGWASELVALADGRAIVRRDAELRLLVPGEPERVASVQDLLPDPKRGALGELALFRSGAGFGVLSNRRVRLWPAADLARSVTMEIDGELPADDFRRRPAPARGVTTDRADEAIAIFHRAGSLPDTIFLARLHLDVERGRAAWRARGDDGHLPTLRSEDFPPSELARLQPSLYPLPLLQDASLAGADLLVCATGPGEKELVRLARVAPDGSAELLLSIDERARASLTSCGRHMLVTFLAPRRVPQQALWSLRERTWVTPIDLAHATSTREILDHDGGVWWLRTTTGLVAAAAPGS